MCIFHVGRSTYERHCVCAFEICHSVKNERGAVISLGALSLNLTQIAVRFFFCKRNNDNGGSLNKRAETFRAQIENLYLISKYSFTHLFANSPIRIRVRRRARPYIYLYRCAVSKLMTILSF